MKQSLRSSALGLAIAAAGLLASVPAFAGSVTSTMPVSASVAASCSISATNAIAFGAYDPAVANATAPLDAAGSVSTICTKNAVVAVTLDQGANKTAASTCTAPARQMKDAGTDLLAYNVYSDSARTKAWACDATNNVSFTSASALTPTVTSAYGRLPAAQDVPAGSYSDSILVTVSF